METKQNEAEVQNSEPKVSKSIVDPKYRGKYKTPDWLGTVINEATNDYKELPATEAREAEGTPGTEGYKPAVAAKPARRVSQGVDVSKVFALGRANGLNLDKFETQRDTHGFGGRIRMTVRNMLQTVAKQRHGLIVDGNFVEAPTEWLKSKDAPTEPTHTQSGEKIAKAKPAAEPTESKLIKAPEGSASESKPAEDGGNAKSSTATARPKRK